MKKFLILPLFLFLLSIAPAHAQYVEVGWAGSLNSNVSVDNYNPFNAGLYELNVWNDNKTSLLFTTVGFCVEPYVDVYNEIGTLNPVNNEDIKKAAWLMSTQWASSSTNKYEHTGLQLAIWDVLGVGINDNNEASFDFYETYMNALNTSLTTGEFAQFSADGYQIVRLPTYQDMLIKNPVPEPATMALFGIGLLGIALVGRKRN